jgi:hypothetical protein
VQEPSDLLLTKAEGRGANAGHRRGVASESSEVGLLRGPDVVVSVAVQWAALLVGTVGMCSGAIAIIADPEVPPQIIKLLRFVSVACLAVCGILFLI